MPFATRRYLLVMSSEQFASSGSVVQTDVCLRSALLPERSGEEDWCRSRPDACSRHAKHMTLWVGQETWRNADDVPAHTRATVWMTHLGGAYVITAPVLSQPRMRFQWCRAKRARWSRERLRAR